MKKHAMRSLLSSVKVILSVTLLAILINLSAAASRIYVGEAPGSESSFDEFVTGGIYYKVTSVEDKTVKVDDPWKKAVEFGKNVVIPAKVVWQDTEYTVTSIGQYALSDSLIESVALPASVVEINSFAFNNAKKLVRITVCDDNPEYCDVDGVLFSKDMTELIRFPMHKAAEIYEVPASVTKIAANAFCGCEFVRRIILSHGVVSVGTNCFCGCELLTSLYFPDSLIYIGSFAMSGCSNLHVVSFGSSLSEIEDKIFSGCTSLKEIVVDSDNKNFCSIGGALYNADATMLIMFPPAKRVDTYSFPETLTSIGSNAFEACTLSQLVLPHNVEKIGRAAFFNTNLECITIPASVSYISDFAFWLCSALREINVDDKNPYFASVDGVLYTKDMSAILKCPQCYSDSVFNVPESVNIIWKRAFCDCKKITSLLLPSSLSEIQDAAFMGCSVKSMVIPDSVKSIGAGVFDYPLISLTIGSSVESIGSNALCAINPNISNIICRSTVPPAFKTATTYMILTDHSSDGIFPYNAYQNAVLYVPAGCKEAYSSAEPWNKFQNIQELKPAK